MIYDLYDLSVVKSILSKYGFKFNKSLGQNFIINREICPKMADECAKDGKSTGIIEIGPGIGTLTKELALRFKKIFCIEKDKRLIPILKETLGNFNNIVVSNVDALKVDYKKLVSDEFSGFDKVMICSNLPYCITSPFIMNILETDCGIKEMILMVQKEAADRICAVPGDKKCGAVSVAVRYYSFPEILFQVKKDCFIPTPKVDSSVIKISIKSNNDANKIDKTKFFKIVRYSFENRRKKLVNSLSIGLNLQKSYVENILDKINVSKSSRAEELTFEDFVNLSKNLI